MAMQFSNVLQVEAIGLNILCFPVRLAVGAMSFIICFIAYMLRANIAIGLLAMVRKNDTDPDYGPRYKWTDNEVGWVQGAFFAGSCISTFPAGFLAEWYGGSLTTTISLIISLILTALTPISSALSVWVLYVNRFLLGIAGWAPRNEKGKFVAALLGGNVGTVVTFQLTGFITEAYGWQFVFYVQTVLILIIVILWMVLVSDAPHKHRFIGMKEIEYIETSHGATVSKERKVPPYAKMFLSVPFISLIVLHYGNLWGLFFLLTIAPEYMKSSLGFNLKDSGIYSSLPHLARFLAGFFFGWMGDRLRNRYSNPTILRKFFCIFSHIIPGLLLLIIPYTDNKELIITILTLSLGFNGAATLTNLQNSQDLAPNFAGTLYSIINFIGLSSGFFGPLLKSKFIEISPKYNFDPWAAMFIFGGCLYVAPAILFWFLGTAEVQEWNEIKKLQDQSDDKNNATRL